jgi:hypothetical protein
MKKEFGKKFLTLILGVLVLVEAMSQWGIGFQS